MPLPLHQRQAIAGGNRSVPQGFERSDLLPQSGRVPTERSVVEGEVVGVLWALVLQVVDEPPMRQVGGQIVLGSNAGISWDSVQIFDKSRVARFWLEQAGFEVVRERQIAKEKRKGE